MSLPRLQVGTVSFFLDAVTFNYRSRLYIIVTRSKAQLQERNMNAECRNDAANAIKELIKNVSTALENRVVVVATVQKSWWSFHFHAFADEFRRN